MMKNLKINNFAQFLSSHHIDLDKKLYFRIVTLYYFNT